MSEKVKAGIKVTTPPFRVAFPTLDKPKQFKDPRGNLQGDPKYSVEMLFPKDADLKEMKQAIQKEIIRQWGDEKPEGLKTVFKDGDKHKKKYDSHKNMFYVRAATKNKVGIVDSNGVELLDPKAVYAGSWCRATVVVMAYENGANAGVTVYLNNLQLFTDALCKKRGLDNSALTGAKNAKDDFDSIEAFDDGESVADDNLDNDDF
jgi:hypothetical protein